MSINATLNTGIRGVQEAMRGAESAASKIARSGTADGAVGSSSELTESVVELKLYERAVNASAQVVRSADETLGTLLDTMA